MNIDMVDAKRKYKQHKSRANKMNIPFRLTFDEWISWWIQSGHWNDRGVGKGKYVMARKGDLGAYELGNIDCITQEENISFAHKNKIVSINTRNKLAKINTGKKHTLAHRNNIGKGQIGRVHSEQSKVSARLNNPRRKPITIDGISYASVRQAIKESGYSQHQIYKML